MRAVRTRGRSGGRSSPRPSLPPSGARPVIAAGQTRAFPSLPSEPAGTFEGLCSVVPARLPLPTPPPQAGEGFPREVSGVSLPVARQAPSPACGGGMGRGKGRSGTSRRALAHSKSLPHRPSPPLPSKRKAVTQNPRQSPLLRLGSSPQTGLRDPERPARQAGPKETLPWK